MVKTVALGLAVAVTLATGCSKSSGTAPSPTLTCSNLPNATTFLLANNAVCPQTMTVSRGTRVTFINNDRIVHEMDSDPHPDHTDCPAINDVDFIQPGQTKLTGNLNIVRTCGYHDHNEDTDTRLQGSIIIR